MHFDEALADDGGAEHDADEFVDLGGDVGGETGELEVAAAVAAFADHALGDAVEGGELEVVEFFFFGGGRRRRLLELAEGFLEGGEFPDEDVGLVDLVRHDHQILVSRETEDVRDGVGGQAPARGVTRVDHDDGADVGSLILGFGVGVLDGGHVRGPATRLVEVVGHTPRVQQG